MNNSEFRKRLGEMADTWANPSPLSEQYDNGYAHALSDIIVMYDHMHPEALPLLAPDAAELMAMQPNIQCKGCGNC